MENKNKNKVIVGFDIGIASVGWCITKLDDLQIVKHGVRTFNTVDNPKNWKLLNEKRREARSHRRQVNRKKTLKRDFIKYLIKSKFIDDLKFDREGKFVNQFREKWINNPSWRKKLDQVSQYQTLGGIFDLREQGLKRELTKQELISVLYWYINHRGFKYTVVEEKPKKNVKGQKEEKKEIHKKVPFPIEEQIAQFKNHGFLNGNFNQKFHKDRYIEEIEQIFKNIKYSLPDKFEKKFLEFFERQRSFEIGPGNKKTFSMYGIRDYDENGKLCKKYDTIWEKTTGKCSIYSKEYRAPKFSFSSDLFNLLNDLNNISIVKNNCQKKLTPEQKMAIIKISYKTSLNLKSVINYLKKEFDLENQSFINGLRSKKITKTKTKTKATKTKTKPTKIIETIMEITPLKTYHFFRKIFKKINYQYPFENFFNKQNEYNNENLIDKLSLIFSKTTLKEKRLVKVKNLMGMFPEIKNFDDQKLKQIVSTPGFKSGTHAFSFKALSEFIPIMLNENQNSQQIIHCQYKSSDLEKYKIKPSLILTNQWIKDLITTPTVKRSLNQTIKIFNTINKYLKENDLHISDITIEMAREKNNQELKENETNYQKILELENNKIDKYLNDYPNIKKSNTLRTKIWLWKQQKGCDAYTGQKIDIDDLIKNNQSFEQDHIIPYSWCFDNSRNNRVLTSKENNQKKGQKTPFQYMSSKKFNEMKQNWNQWYLNNCSEDRKMFYSQKKYNFLISEKDFSDPQVQLKSGFIGRNLVDTRYTTKEFLGVLNRFKEINNLKFNVKTVNGKMTSFIRSRLIKNRLFLKNPCFWDEELRKMQKKDRIWHGHHAQDAYICTFLCKWYKDQKRIEEFIDFDLLNKKNSENRASKTKIESEKKFYHQKFQEIEKATSNICHELNAKSEKMLFSRKIEKKSSTILFNETLYRGIKKGDQIQKLVYKNLLEMKKKDCEKYFASDGKEREKVIMKKWNKEMYLQLCDIYKKYKEEIYPFKKAAEDKKKDFISYSIKNKEIIVKKIQIEKELKNKNDIILIKKDLKNKENKNSFFDSMEPIKVHLYKNKKNELKLITINALNCKFFVKPFKDQSGNWINKNSFKIIEEKLNSQKQKFDISLENKPIDVFYKGEILEIKDLNFKGEKIKAYKDLFYFIGGSTNTNKIEIKPINYDFNKYFNFKKNLNSSWRITKTINGLKYKKIKLNCLGFKI